MKKILSIDGGGIKGIYAAALLAVLEEKCEVKLCDYFDMIAGTSTGGIIAAALSLGISAKEVLNLYFQEGEKIFPKHKWWSFGKGKYDTEPLKCALEKVLKDTCIKECKTRLIMPAYNIETNKVRVFKTPHAKDLHIDKDYRISDCVLATTAAPLYFKPHYMTGGKYIDGGVGANNPSSIALIEGLTRCEWDITDIAMLSIGGVNELGPTTGEEKMGIRDALTIQKCFMNAESQYAHNICKIVLPKEQYIRIEQPVMSGQAKMDKATPEIMNRLKNWGEDQAKNHIDNISNLFFAEKKTEVKFFNI